VRRTNVWSRNRRRRRGLVESRGSAFGGARFPMGATFLSNIGLRLSEEAEKEVEEAMSVPSERVVW